MNGALNHLLIAPVLLPLATAVLMLLLGEQRRSLKATLNVLATFAMLGIAIALLLQADAPAANGEGANIGVYLLGNWPAPFGIVLVLDRLSALMLTLTALLALAALLFSLARWHRAGAHFHPLFQLQLMGLNGAFLTGDLFNLFVFFEVMLAASYGLLLHGSGGARVKASLHYIAINLAASSLFLIGAALLYGVCGTLNMADLAARIPALPASDRMLMEAGAAILGVAFLIKAGIWPLNFWLVPAYSAAAAPVAALLAILSKVGVYVLLRVWLLFFGESSGASAQFGSDWLLYGGLITIVFGSIGALASQGMARLTSYSVLISAGTLLAVLGTGQSAVIGSALFYLVSSTLSIGALFLLVELIERGRHVGADVLAVTMEAFGDAEDETEEEVGIAIPATMAVLGISFMCCALLIAGLPPLSGFIAKFSILSSLLGALDSTAVLSTAGMAPNAAWLLLLVLLSSGMMLIVAMGRAGIRNFWSERGVPRVRVIEVIPVVLLLFGCALMTVQAGPFMRYMEHTAAALHAPQNYVRGVLSAMPVPAPAHAGERL
jgi:multicomponent K+:H+ antiporter subunit D